MPVSQLKTALQIIEQGKYCELEKMSLGREIDLINRRLDLKNTTISILDKRIANLDSSVDYNLRNIQIYKTQLEVVNKNNEGDKLLYSKELKRERRKTSLYKFTTLAAVIAGAYVALRF